MCAQHSMPVGARSSTSMICCRVVALWAPLLWITFAESAPAAGQTTAVCPDVLAGAVGLQALKSCRQAARDSEGRKRAHHYRTALAIGRAAYMAGRDQFSGPKDAKKRWLAKNGQMFVHYGTLDCATAVDLEPADARAALDDCIDLLTT